MSEFHCWISGILTEKDILGSTKFKAAQGCTLRRIMDGVTVRPAFCSLPSIDDRVNEKLCPYIAELVRR